MELNIPKYTSSIRFPYLLSATVAIGIILQNNNTPKTQTQIHYETLKGQKIQHPKPLLLTILNTYAQSDIANNVNSLKESLKNGGSLSYDEINIDISQEGGFIIYYDGEFVDMRVSKNQLFVSKQPFSPDQRTQIAESISKLSSSKNNPIP